MKMAIYQILNKIELYSIQNFAQIVVEYEQLYLNLNHVGKFINWNNLNLQLRQTHIYWAMCYGIGNLFTILIHVTLTTTNALL